MWDEPLAEHFSFWRCNIVNCRPVGMTTASKFRLIRISCDCENATSDIHMYITSYIYIYIHGVIIGIICVFRSTKCTQHVPSQHAHTRFPHTCNEHFVWSSVFALSHVWVHVPPYTCVELVVCYHDCLIYGAFVFSLTCLQCFPNTMFALWGSYFASYARHMCQTCPHLPPC